MGLIGPMAADINLGSSQSARGSAPSSAPRLRFGMRLLLIAYAGVFVSLAALIVALALLGNTQAASPLVSILLRPFPSQGEAEAMRGGAFRDTREIAGNLVADPTLIEDFPQGPLPRIARDGRTALKAYGRALAPAGKRPRIALVVRGLGAGATDTMRTLAETSPGITLAFTPFAADLQSEVDKARGAGHEVLLEVPMEPFDFPDSDPGPHALLAAASPEENAKRLDWALSRATGYVGVMNLLGGRFLGEESAIQPILDRIAKRGLMFFDNGASSSSVAITSARHVRAPIASGTLTLDGVQTRAAIDSKLAEMENAARQDGFAIGVASPYPVSIARLEEWAANANARGFDLVPLSGLAKTPDPGVASSQ